MKIHFVAELPDDSPVVMFSVDYVADLVKAALPNYFRWDGVRVERSES